MNEDVDDKEDLTNDDLCVLLKNLEKNYKNKYKFILKAGSSYQNCLFKLFKLTWLHEIKPAQWEKTTAHQLYKESGETNKR